VNDGGAGQAPDTIGARILSGVAWKATSQVTLQLTRMVVALVLARMLAPHDWGLAAMVLIFAAFVVVFTDNALGTALIQRRDLREEDKSTVFWLTAVLGVVLALAGIAGARPLAAFYGEPAVAGLFAALSVGFFVTTLGTTHMALLAREMEFRLLELRQIAATLAGAVAGISVALAHFGAWAIIAQQLGEATISTILLWVFSPWRPTRTFSRASIRRLRGFAGNVFAENLLYQSGRNVSSLLMGRFLGPAAVGAYALSTNVILVPFARIAGPLQQVFFPAFTRMNGDRERMADVWIRATRLVGLVAIPSLVGLAIVAPDFVQVVLGDKWHRVTPVIQVLAVVGIVQSLQTLTGEVLLALGRASWLLRFTAVWFVGAVASFVVGVHWGVVGVAVAYTAATLAIEPLRTYLTARALGISPFRPLVALAGILQATALLAAAVVPARVLLVHLDVQPLPRLIALVALGGCAYVAGCLWRAPDLAAELRLVRRRRPAPASVVEAAPTL
jgi:O-antigen/teichoic acid export membrane protein